MGSRRATLAWTVALAAVAARIPLRRRPGRWPMVWGVAADGDLVVLSDVPSDLYVLRPVR